MSKILIVDDFEENRYLLRNYLESDGYDVIEAKNGVEALNLLKNEKIDLIISDILMPQMDGFTLCRNVKMDEKLKLIPFVFYTATYTDEQDEKLALSLGASKFILKPKEKDEFNKIIKDVMEQFSVGGIKTLQIEEKDLATYYKLYNEVLIRKLESKMIQLEKVNKELEKKIIENEKINRQIINNLNYFSKVIDKLNNPLAILDENYIIREANQKFCEIFGEKSKIININFFSIDDDFFEQTELKFLFEDLDEKNFVIDNYEIEIEKNNLSKKIYSIKASKVLTKDENSYDIIILMEDITEFKRLLKEKESIYNRLLQLERAESIGKFAGGIAHDFNNILTIILNSSQLILDSLKEDDPLYEDVKNIYDAGVRGSELTKKILMFSRKKETTQDVIDIHREINEIDKLAKRLIGEDIKIEYLLLAEETNVLMDSINFQQVLINLFSNAKDAMPNGGKILVKTQNIEINQGKNENILPGKYIKIEVSDTGNGIENQVLNQIFEPFFTTKKSGKGTGLGLYLVYSIIQQSNGYIYACSELGKGTTFIILLPLLSEFLEKKIETIEDAKFVLRDKYILLIEDDPIVMAAIEKMLLKINVKIEKAKNAKEALELIDKGFVPDSLITDMILEDMSADTLIRIIKKKLGKVNVLYMSGYSKEEFSRRNIIINDSNFIQKPFTLKQLQEKIYNLFINQ
ncbi:MAG TPA: response regulator [Exilispira sp.]|nr:response regulator [Exilispira sp.]